MKIALVTDCYPPRTGGIEVQVAGLAEQLRTTGHRVRVLTSTPGPGLPGVVRVPPPAPGGLPVNPAAWPQLRRVLGGADVVHGHVGVLGPFAQHAVHVAAHAGVPCVLTWHSLPGRSALGAALGPGWRRLVDLGVQPTAVSSVAASQLARILRREHVPVLRNGVDLARWASPSADTHPWNGVGRPAHLVSTMRFAARKRPVHLVALLARVRAQLAPAHRFRLTLLGDGPWWRPLRGLVENTRLRAWVDLPGPVPRERVAQWLSTADLYVSASRQEAFGIAALEARCVGLPVAGYASSGVRDVVDHDAGGVLAQSDRDLVGQLVALLNDPARLRRYAEHHRAELPWQHDWPAVVEATHRHYERARGEPWAGAVARGVQAGC